MNTKKVTRVVLDVVLTAMIIAEMFIQFTGVFLHEVIGFVFFATVLVHLILSAKWIKNTASNAKRGKMTARRTALAVVGVLLAVTMVVLGVSSVAISNILADAGFSWTLGSYAMWTSVHSVSSYALCAIVAVHLAMHWAFLASAFHVPYDPSRRRAIGAGVNAVAAVGVLALGFMAVKSAVPQIASANDEATSSNGNDAKATSSSNASSASGSNSASSSSQGRTGKPGSSSSSASSGGSASAGSTPSGSTGSSSSNGTSGSSDTSGICTLCRKRCPLSDPQCDKPYTQGLI